MSSRAYSYLNLVLCILFWASIPVASKKILAELNNLQMLFYSTVFSALALGALVAGQGKGASLFRYSLREYAHMGWLGFLGAFLYYVLLYGAFARTSAAEGFVLAYTWPILVSLLAAPLLGQKLSALRLIAIAISFGGVVMIVTRGRMLAFQTENLAGNLLALCGALVFALFSILGRRADYDLTIAAFFYFCSALVCAGATIFIVGQLPLPSLSVWGWILYNGLLVNGVSYLFWFRALEHGDTFAVSNLLYLTPALSLPLVRLFLNEPVQASAVSGLILIVFGILLQSWPKLAEASRSRAPDV
ncbi:MAG: DMT family transporter [Caldilineaceae bacterium SB0661_bin_32]|uniref:DMT family transporter n=1 Tax=Caldilineaceae bacterium SB0661_bin_32 TaxID=2605255 RepID=A0A6B1D7V2_9CHLR|nr:DMT family transporter [Caldilineaceae bacterium SB0661_bin_32]